MTVSIQGHLQDFYLPQLVALFEAMQSSGRLEVHSSKVNGFLVFDDGIMIDAEVRDSSGELAAFLILASDEGTFSFHKGSPNRPPALNRSNQSLCMEAMRLLDESRDQHSRYHLESTPPTGTGSAITPPQERVLGVLGGHSASVREVSTSCGISDLEAYYHLEMLTRSGLVRRNRNDHAEEPVPVESSDNVRVLIVDDSALMRRTLSRLFSSARDFEVVGEAATGLEALDLIPKVRPNVISLDLHMPDMDGVATLKRIMLSDPIPTVILTAADPEELDRTFDAILRFGAVDFTTKPSRMRGTIDAQGQFIVNRLRIASRVNLRGVRLFQPRLSLSPGQSSPGDCQGLVAAIAGTGACLSFMQLLSQLPADLPFGILGLLSLSEDFLRAFAKYMRRYSAFNLKIAAQGDRIQAGVCYLATHDTSLRLADDGDGPQLVANRSSTKVDPNLLLSDTAHIFAGDGVGLLMSSETFNCDDGLREIARAGGLTFAQLPETCIDPTGPQAAIDHGLIQRTVILNRFASELSQAYAQRSRRQASSGAREEGNDSCQAMIS